jgi:hypothetical protein
VKEKMAKNKTTERQFQLGKDYRLCCEYGSDHLVIDEYNGVKLAAGWIGGVLLTSCKYDNLALISTI